MTTFKMGDIVRLKSGSDNNGARNDINNGGSNPDHIRLTKDINGDGEFILGWFANRFELVPPIVTATSRTLPDHTDYIVAALDDDGELIVTETPRVYDSKEKALSDAEAAMRLFGGDWAVLQVCAFVFEQTPTIPYEDLEADTF